MIVSIVISADTKLILPNFGQRIILLLKDKMKICGKNANSQNHEAS